MRYAGVIAADQSIATIRPKVLQRLDRGSIVEHRGMCSPAVKRSVVRNTDWKCISEYCIVFHNQYPWRYLVDRPPDPIVIAIDVDAKYTDLTREPMLLQ